MRALNPAHIAFFVSTADVGGAERTLISLSSQLAQSDYEVDLILASAEGELLATVPNNVNVINLNATSRYGLLGFGIQSLLGMINYMRRHQETIILSTLTGCNVVALLARLFTGSRNKVYIRQAIGFNGITNPLIRFLSIRLYPKASIIISTTQSMLSETIHILGNNTEHVIIPNGIDIKDVNHMAKQCLPGNWEQIDKPLVVAIGRLHSQKGFDILIKSFSNVDRDATLVIIGDGKQRQYLENLITKLDLSERVFLIGLDNNPYRWMRLANVVVLASHYEGFPNVMLEGLALGKTIVATRCSHGPDEILDNGRYGYLCSVNDPTGMARSINDALRAPLPKAQAIERAQYYDISTIVKLYSDLFTKNNSF